mgnify:FL=1|jgi:hypothetical protein
MPQYVSYAKIKDYDKVCYIPDEKEKNEKGEPLYNLSPITNYIRIATMSIGMHSITEKNYKDFYQRLMFQRELSEYKEDLLIITLDDVKAHIGLEVQQSRSWMKEETRKAFVFRMYKSYIERL